ncbi:hypothetical protein IIM_00620 [Bacillus cereus VD107]|nr:hypothetical protein IIM_00620 [Bacillus cereus VD107]
MRKTFRLLRRGLKDKGKNVDKHIEWQRNVIRFENVEENGINKTEKAIHSKGRDSVE